MLSKNKLKFIKSLQIKKYRKQERLFLVEGAKSVSELLTSDYKISSLYLTDDFYNCCQDNVRNKGVEYNIVTPEDLSKAGAFETNNAALAIVEMKPNRPVYAEKEEYVLVLDEIKDPGNFGTIIRIADWFGINKVVCSETTADFYNPKVISASMGAFTRVTPYYCQLNAYLAEANLPVYGAFLNGNNIHTVAFAREGYIVMGNESNGISAELEQFISQKITIPGYGKSESLNVAVATAIVLDNLRRITI